MSAIADINIMLFLQSMITLLAILDPVGNIPVFSSLTSKLSKKERVKTVNKAFLIATGILIGFGFFGGYLLILLGITMNDLKLISGLILLIFSIDYVLGRNVNYLQKNSETNLSFHSGPVVHISPTFDRQIVDLIPKSKNDELDRWIPLISKYKRINFENLTDEIIENI